MIWLRRILSGREPLQQIDLLGLPAEVRPNRTDWELAKARERMGAAWSGHKRNGVVTAGVIERAHEEAIAEDRVRERAARIHHLRRIRA